MPRTPMHSNQGTRLVPLTIVTPELVENDARERDRRQLAIACRLIADARGGVSRVTVCGATGTYVFEPQPADGSAADTTVPQPVAPAARLQHVWSALVRRVAGRRHAV